MTANVYCLAQTERCYKRLVEMRELCQTAGKRVGEKVTFGDQRAAGGPVLVADGWLAIGSYQG